MYFLQNDFANQGIMCNFAEIMPKEFEVII